MSGVYHGACHCGAVGWVFKTRIDPSVWTVRACQCAFCRMHAARCTSDPDGSVELTTSDGELLRRYRFGLRTADFLICARCGVYLGAVIDEHGRAYATINLNTMTTPVERLPDAVAVDYDAEDAHARIERRASKWTPVVSET